MAITTDQADKVLELYSAYFNRAADAEGFEFWQNSFNTYYAEATSTATDADKESYALQRIVGDMATSTEYIALYPSTQSSTEFVGAIYTNLLNRDSDAEGLKFWSDHIDVGSLTKEQAILQMIAGAKANTTTQGVADAALITNKNMVSKYFAETIKSNDLTLAQGAFSGVTDDAATAETAKAALDASVSEGTTFALTTSVDLASSFAFTTDDDTFVGTSAATDPTINLGDAIDGGDGTDTLKIISSLTSAIPSIETQNIEKYLITNSGAGSFAISNQSTTPSMVTFLNGSNTTFTLSGLKTTTTIGLETEAGQITLAFDQVTGTEDAANLSVNNTAATASINVGSGIETINLATTGAASTLASLVGANVSKLMITGDQALTITTALANAVTTLDASAATGAISLSVATGGDVALTGGTADDYLSVAGLDGSDSIDGGAGDDTLSIDTDIASSSEVANVTNIETLKFTAATTQDLSVLSATGISSFKFAEATANAAYTKNESSFTHIMSEKTAGDFSATPASNTSADTLTIELWNSDLGILDATGYETINLKSGLGDETGTVINIITTLTNDAGSTLTITGNTDLTITDPLNQGTINASALTGKLTVIGSASADAITGGTAADMLTGGAGLDTITGNAGDDNFVVLSTTDLDTTAGAVTDIITDFTVGTNTISGLGTAASATNYFEEETASSATDLASLLTAASGKLNGTIKYYLDSIGSDTYLVVDDDAIDPNGGSVSGYTDVIKLTGTALTDIDSSSIVA
jgi:Ca2+-binding RTX toxin-like protein